MIVKIGWQKSLMVHDDLCLPSVRQVFPGNHAGYAAGQSSRWEMVGGVPKVVGY